MNYKIIASTGSAGVLLITLVALCFLVGQGREVRALNIVVLVFGAAAGWLARVLVSPDDPTEARTFPQYAGAISAFASGYLVSKADRVLEQILDPETLFSPVAAFRILAAVSTFAITLLITYVYRVYPDEGCVRGVMLARPARSRPTGP